MDDASNQSAPLPVPQIGSSSRMQGDTSGQTGYKEDELSEEDLAVLRAFDAMDLGGWEGENTEIPVDSPGEQDVITLPTVADTLSPDDMLTLFAGEVDEDMTTIRRALRQLEPDDQLDVEHLQTVQRMAHKIKGTAGAIGCTAISTIAHHLEELIKLIVSGTVVPFIGLNALVQTVHALELTLNSFVTYGQESPIPLIELEEEYEALNIDMQVGNVVNGPAPTRHDDEAMESAPFVRIEPQRFEQLLLHSEQLAELSAPLENAQAELEKALQELHTAQARLQYLETLLSIPSAQTRRKESEERPTSSLVARILDESAQRTGHIYQRKMNIQPYQPGSLQSDESLRWDALEIDRFTETDVLIRSFNEAIADVATATSQLRNAYAQLGRIAQKYMDQATNVRNATLLLRLAPMSILIPRIEHVITTSALAQQRRVQFEVEGATTEIDQDILEELKHPLLQLMRTCVAHSFTVPQQSTEQAEQSEDTGHIDYTDHTERIWINVQASGNEVTIEVGFSLIVGGSDLDEVQEAIRRLNGSISAQRNAMGGISFFLRLPRSHGAVHGLLVRVGNQRVVVPFSHVQRIDDGKRNLAEAPASLNTLLGFPNDQATAMRPVLMLHPGLAPRPVQVDEILGEVKLVVRPLAPHLRRNGIAGAAIDGTGNVLLMVDLPELLRRQEMQQPSARLPVSPSPGMEKVAVVGATQNNEKHAARRTQKLILIADDSVYIRQSLLQTLSNSGYRVATARDGREALELLLANPPHVLLLDMEMPILNGYELLSIIRVHPELARVKIVMLTSRSSEKHQARARELGAHAYLTKPCPHETLLETIQYLLTS